MEQPFHSQRAVPQSRLTPAKMAGLGASLLLQAGFVYAIISGLAGQIISKLPEELKVAVEQEKIAPKPPPPPPPQVELPPPPVAPPPEINIESPVTTSPITVTNKPPPPAPPMEKPAITQPASIGARHTCDQNKYYPPLSVKLGEQGTTTVSFKIDTNGEVKDPTISKSSGSDRLDQATIACVSNWHYKPALQNGQPVEFPWSMNMKWQLH